LLSLFGAERYANHRWEWAIVAAVMMCVVIIIFSGVRNALLAGRDPVDGSSKPQPNTAVPQGKSRPAAVERDPREISEILERLDAVIGRSEHAAGTVEGDGDPPSQPETDSAVGQPALAAASEAEGVTGARSDGTTDAEAGVAVVTTSTATATKSAFPSPTPNGSEAPAVFRAAPTQRSSAMTDDERTRIEHFREISRMMNRADIDRRHREQMRDEWMSVGVTALACVVTGTVCVFTSCFASMSVPIGSVMFSVATVLLMRPSLYPQLPPQDAAAIPLADGDVPCTK
jgi:hypothetical protein